MGVGHSTAERVAPWGGRGVGFDHPRRLGNAPVARPAGTRLAADGEDDFLLLVMMMVLFLLLLLLQSVGFFFFFFF